MSKREEHHGNDDAGSSAAPEHPGDDTTCANSAAHGRHELPPHQPRPAIGRLRQAGSWFRRPRGRSQLIFGALAVLLCLVLGIAIVTQVRETGSGDALQTARPADLLVLLDSLRQREAALNAEVADLQRILTSLQASGSSNQAAIENAQARLAALSILVGTVGATGPGVRVTIDDPGPGVAPQAMLDVINEMRAAGAEAIEINDGHQAVRVGIDTWVVGAPGALTIDGKRLSPPYFIAAIGDSPTLAAAMNIPGGAVDSVKRVGGRMSMQQSDRVDVTALRQPKPRQYAQPVK